MPLAAIYPRDGTLASDNPSVVLDASWVDDATRTAAADFLAYVRTRPAGRFTESAFPQVLRDVVSNF